MPRFFRDPDAPRWRPRKTEDIMFRKYSDDRFMVNIHLSHTQEWYVERQPSGVYHVFNKNHSLTMMMSQETFESYFVEKLKAGNRQFGLKKDPNDNKPKG